MNAYVTKNFWGYEQLNPSPQLLDNTFFKYYITDNLDSKDYLLNNGWDEVIIIEDYKNITNLQSRRRIISEINCFPQKYIANLNKFNKVFITDSNVVSLWDEFLQFTNSCPTDKCLYVTSGWYSEERNSIESELHCSNQSRWSYDYENMKTSVERYKIEITNKEINFNNIPVMSAKYFGWNLNHPLYETISKHFYDEYSIHLQGNIILSYLSSIYKNSTFEYKISSINNGALSDHQFLG
jgi:hypothetical protein